MRTYRGHDEEALKKEMIHVFVSGGRVMTAMTQTAWLSQGRWTGPKQEQMEKE